jgi:hypothetical protein
MIICILAFRNQWFRCTLQLAPVSSLFTSADFTWFDYTSSSLSLFSLLWVAPCLLSSFQSIQVFQFKSFAFTSILYSFVRHWMNVWVSKLNTSVHWGIFYFSLELTLFNIQSLTSTRLSAQRILHSSVRVLDCLNRVKIWLKRKNKKNQWLMCNVLFLFMTFALRKYTRWKHIAMSIQLVRLSFRH